MTFKRPYSAGLAALAVGLFAATAAYAEPTVNKGDNAWMLTSTVLVLLMTIPGLALFYGGLVRSKNMLSVLMQVFYTVCIVILLCALYGYSLAFTGGSDFIGGFSKAFLKSREARRPRCEGGDLQRRRQHHGADLHLLPDDVRGDHPGPHRRRLRRTHEVRGGRAVRPALGHADLPADRAHGLVLGRTGRDHGCAQGAGSGG